MVVTLLASLGLALTNHYTFEQIEPIIPQIYEYKSEYPGIVDRDWIALYKKEIGVEYRLDKTHYIEYTLDTFQAELKKAGLKRSPV